MRYNNLCMDQKTNRMRRVDVFVSLGSLQNIQLDQFLSETTDRDVVRRVLDASFRLTTGEGQTLFEGSLLELAMEYWKDRGFALEKPE